MDDFIEFDDIESSGNPDFSSLLPDREIRGLISRNFEQIKFIGEWLGRTHKNTPIFEEIETKLQDGKLTKGQLNDLHHALMLGKLNKQEKLEANLYSAFIYNTIARNLASEDRLIMAWKAISLASSFLGHSNQIHSDLANPESSNAKAGGEGKARALLEINKLVITTLITDRPTKGWDKISTATEKIMNRYDELSTSKAFKIKREDAKIRMINLLHEDKLVKLFFSSE
ncbi:hypothetical protein [Pseudomonas sp. W2-17]|uniref:hypothetical protein n=1 Tax=Pseudomonas sp. W2-17 TaxID=3058039 RepID=UPI0034E05FDF